MDNRNIYRSATHYINQYGAGASVQAATVAEGLLARGDLEGFNVWMRIGRAIEDLQATGGGTKHQ